MTIDENAPPGEVGPRPGHHPDTEDTDTYLTSTPAPNKAGRHCHHIGSERHLS